MNDIWKRCNKCGCLIDDNDDHIEAVKWGTRVYYCKEHVAEVEDFMKWYGEIVEIKAQKIEPDNTWRAKLHRIISDTPEPIKVSIDLCTK